MKVTAPDGRTWTVHRRWFPKAPRFRPGTPKGLDAADGAFVGTGSHSVGDLVIGFVVVALLSALGWLVLPALLFLLQLVLLLVVLPAYVALRVVFRQPWIVEATTRSPRHLQLGWAVRGLRRSGQAMAEIAEALQSGREPAPSEGRPLKRNPSIPPPSLR